VSEGARVRLAGEADVAAAARAARDLAVACGLSPVESQHVATAVSEVARNALLYARGGVAELVPCERGGRRGLQVVVRDGGPGIADVEAALREGVSTGGSLGLGLPGARRLMDDFAIESGPGGTVVTMTRWAGGRIASHLPVVVDVFDGPGGVALAQPFRNGILLALAAGARSAEVADAWRARAWHAPSQLVQACRAVLDPGERAGLAVASFSALDGRLAWLAGGAVGAILLRASGGIVLRPRAGSAVGPGGGGPAAAVTVDVRRDDVLVLAAAPLEAPDLAALVDAGDAPGPPARLVARFERGSLEPRRPASTLEGR
jgi:serine/threonine-protein kinase RsbT